MKLFIISECPPFIDEKMEFHASDMSLLDLKIKNDDFEKKYPLTPRRYCIHALKPFINVILIYGRLISLYLIKYVPDTSSYRQLIGETKPF